MPSGGRESDGQTGQVQDDFVPAKQGSHPRQKVGHQRRVIVGHPHGYRRNPPVHLETKKIRRMLLDPFRRPNEEHVIRMDRLVEKRAKTTDQDDPNHDAGMR